MKPSEIALDHYLHPRNLGELEAPDGQATVMNPQCGDVTRLSVKVSDGVVTQVRWRTEGCGTAKAASSLASQLISGKRVEEAAQVSRETIARALGGLTPAKRHCAVLAADAIREALRDYRDRHPAGGA